jgi:hypothetical protein
VGEAFSVYLGSVDLRAVVAYFDSGGSLKLPADVLRPRSCVAQLRRVPGCSTMPRCWAPGTASRRRVVARGRVHPRGAHAQKKIGRSEDRGFFALRAPRTRTSTSSGWSGCAA